MARGNTTKDKEYLLNNPIVMKFVADVNDKIKDYYEEHLSNLKPEYLTVDVGNKYIRLWKGTTCWGFISRVDGDLKGAPIKKGDLLKPATWKAPAKHARGNIMDGTATWGVYGPQYIK
jgi:hypothetical protein